jgi:FMN phosphatase YigB (HAD superfamily)
MRNAGGPTSCGVSRSLAAILFDFGGTLDAPGIPWKDRLFDLFRAQGARVTLDDFARAFYRADDALVGTVAPTLSLRDTVFRLVNAVGASLAFDDPRAMRRVAQGFIEGAVACVHANARLLADLARRYRLGLVSNFYGNLTGVCEELGLAPYLSVTVDSAVIGCSKPDPRIFREALARLTVEVAEAVYVGDSPSRDMAGARAVGMAHIWLVGPTALSSTPCCPQDHVIRSLDELPGVLP